MEITQGVVTKMTKNVRNISFKNIFLILGSVLHPKVGQEGPGQLLGQAPLVNNGHDF